MVSQGPLCLLSFFAVGGAVVAAVARCRSGQNHRSRQPMRSLDPLLSARSSAMPVCPGQHGAISDFGTPEVACSQSTHPISLTPIAPAMPDRSTVQFDAYRSSKGQQLHPAREPCGAGRP